MRLQACKVSIPESSSGDGVVLIVAGANTKPAVVGCHLSGGENTVVWHEGAHGLLEGCSIKGVRGAGLALVDSPTAPNVVGNIFEGSRVGVYLHTDMNDAWALGEGNTFEGITEMDVLDRRGQVLEEEEEGEEEDGDEEEGEEQEVPAPTAAGPVLVLDREAGEA